MRIFLIFTFNLFQLQQALFYKSQLFRENQNSNFNLQNIVFEIIGLNPDYNDIKNLYDALGQFISFNEKAKVKQDTQIKDSYFLKTLVQKLYANTKAACKYDIIKVEYDIKIEIKNFLIKLQGEISTLDQRYEDQLQKIQNYKKNLHENQEQQTQMFNGIFQLVNGIFVFFNNVTKENAIEIIQQIDVRVQENYFEKFSLLSEHFNSKKFLILVNQYNEFRSTDLSIHDLRLWQTLSLISSYLQEIKIIIFEYFQKNHHHLSNKLMDCNTEIKLIDITKQSLKNLIKIIQDGVYLKNQFLKQIDQNSIIFDDQFLELMKQIESIIGFSMEKENFYQRKREELSQIVRDIVQFDKIKKDSME